MATPSPRPLRPLPPPPPSERGIRHWERVSPKHHILVSAIGHGDLLGRGLVLNISSGGVCVHLHNGFEFGAGEEILLRMSFFGHRELIRAFGRVVWRLAGSARSAHYGLAWIEGADLDGVRRLVPSLT